MNPRIVLLLAAAAVLVEGGPRILVHGHRGARAVRPENTIPAFEYAISAGADFLELDLAVTSDDVLVVSHDPLINTRICTGPGGERAIRKLTLEQVRQWDCGALKNPDFPLQQPVPGTPVPTFDEVLGLAGRGSFSFNVEMKSDPKQPELQPAPERFAQLVAAAIRRHKLEQRVVVQSFDFRCLRAIHALAGQLRLSALYAGLPRSLVEISKEAGGTPIVSPHYMLISREKVGEAHQAGLEVVPWTANTPEAWDKLIGMGVDAIITDDPAALIAHLRAKGLR